MLVVIATLRPKAEHLEHVTAVLSEAAARVRKRCGCMAYDLYRGKGCVVVVEKWSDGEALRSWGDSAGLRQLHADLQLYVADLDNNFVIVRPVDESGADTDRVGSGRSTSGRRRTD